MFNYLFEAIEEKEKNHKEEYNCLTCKDTGTIPQGEFDNIEEVPCIDCKEEEEVDNTQ